MRAKTMETFFIKKVSCEYFSFIQGIEKRNCFTLFVTVSGFDVTFFMLLSNLVLLTKNGKMGFTKEFREFALKGNVMDLAVGVIIGGAFGTIVDALVKDIIMPPISLMIGDKGFTNYYLPVSDPVREALAANPALSLEEARKLGAVIAWGDFITVVINFLILAFVIFLMVKGMNRLKREPEVATTPSTPPPPSPQEQLLMDIREELRKQNAGL